MPTSNATPQNKESTAEDTKPTQAFGNQKNIMWVILSGSLMILVIALLVLGGGDAIISSVYSVMLWCGLFGGSLMRYLGKNGWAGFGFGSAIGMVIHVLAPLIFVSLS